MPEWDLDMYDLHIFTGWNLYDLHDELHMFSRDGQIFYNQIKLENGLMENPIHEQRN